MNKRGSNADFEKSALDGKAEQSKRSLFDMH